MRFFFGKKMASRVLQAFCAVLITFAPLTALAETLWNAQITVSYADDSNKLIIGAARDATDGFENLYEGRAILAGYLMAYFLHPEWGVDTQYFWSDIKDENLPKEWEFRVSSQFLNKQLEMRWEIMAPETLGLTLVDEISGATVDMKSMSSYTYTNTATAARLFRVIASGDLGQAADTVPPDTVITSIPGEFAGPGDVFISYTGSDDVVAVDSLQFSSRLDNGVWSDWTTDKSVAFSGLSDGAHVFNVKARDEAGNEDATPAETGFTVDTSGPALSLKNAAPSLLWPPDGRMVYVRVTGAATDAVSNVDSISYNVDDEYGSLGSAGTVTPLEGGGFTFTVRLEAARSGEDPDGRIYTVNVTAVDAAGNSTTRSVRVFVPHDWSRARYPGSPLSGDTISPDTQITSAPGALISQSSVAVSYGGSDNVTAADALEFSWRIDGGAWSAWSVARTADITGLSDGAHVFYVKARDEAGNMDWTPARTSFTVDATGPALSLKHPAPSILWPADGRMLYVRITGVATDGLSNVDTISYSVDDEYGSLNSTGTVTPRANGGFTFTVLLEAARLAGDLDGRVYTVNVTAVDAAGNSTTRSVRAFVPYSW